MPARIIKIVARGIIAVEQRPNMQQLNVFWKTKMEKQKTQKIRVAITPRPALESCDLIVSRGTVARMSEIDVVDFSIRVPNSRDWSTADFIPSTTPWRPDTIALGHCI
jgi:hypothetical protein